MRRQSDNVQGIKGSLINLVGIISVRGNFILLQLDYLWVFHANSEKAEIRLDKWKPTTYWLLHLHNGRMVIQFCIMLPEVLREYRTGCAKLCSLIGIFPICARCGCEQEYWPDCTGCAVWSGLFLAGAGCSRLNENCRIGLADAYKVQRRRKPRRSINIRSPGYTHEHTDMHAPTDIYNYMYVGGITRACAQICK